MVFQNRVHLNHVFFFWKIITSEVEVDWREKRVEVP